MDENNYTSTPPEEPENGDQNRHNTPYDNVYTRPSYSAYDSRQTQQNNSSYPYSQAQSGDSYGTQYAYSQTGYNRPKKEKKHTFSNKIVKAIVLAVLFGIAAGSAFQAVGYLFAKMPGSNYASGGVATIVTTSSEGKQSATYDVTEIVENVMPAMVAIDITATQTVQNPYGFFGFPFGFGNYYEQEVSGSGTGIILSQNNENLYIVTNYHVIEDAKTITVTFIDGKSASATVQGGDEDSDLAVVAVSLDKIEKATRDQIKIAVMGDSDTLRLGEPAIAIGNALGYGQSVTVGHISALEKEVQLTDKTMTLVQTDAAINPGNSGGALINGNGEVIGINSVKLASTDIEGIGYAIPISDALPIIYALMNGTALPESEKPYLGISGTDVTEQYQERFGLPEGVYVSSVTEKSPAAKGGMKAYDIITSFDDTKIKTMDELTAALSEKKAGDTVTITVMRHSEHTYNEVTLTVTLDSVSNAPTEKKDNQNSQNYGYNDFFGFFN